MGRDSGDLQRAPVSTDTELGGYMREFETRVRQDTDEIYMRLDDEQTERQPLAGRLNMLFRDRRAHTYTCHLMETEARLSREAWVRSTDASDFVRGEIVISEMLRVDHRISTEIIELRTALQGQVTALQGQVNDKVESSQATPKAQSSQAKASRPNVIVVLASQYKKLATNYVEKKFGTRTAIEGSKSKGKRRVG
nr:hypothetical protein [Tanacetum cinerariifolium]